MSKGKRYNGEQKLNIKKVFAVIIAIAVMIMFVFVIKTLLSKSKGEKVIASTYFVALENNKYGVIDNKGNAVVPPSYAEYITIPNSKKAVFLCTYDVNYQTGEYKTKALNEKNEQIWKEYDSVEALQNRDKNENVFYEENLLKVKQEERYGLISLEGKEILPCEYTNITILPGVTSQFVIDKDGKKGVVDNKGKIMITPTYQEILPLGEDYKLGYIVKNENGKLGVVNTSNEPLVEMKYEEIKPLASISTFAVKEDGKWKALKTSGETIAAGKYDEIKAIEDNEMIVGNKGKYGVISIDGEERLPLQYQDVNFAFLDTYMIKQNNKFGLVKLGGDIVIEPHYVSMHYYKEPDFIEASEDGIQTDIISNDYSIKMTGILSEINLVKEYFRIRVGENYQYYNFKFEEKSAEDTLVTNTLFLKKENGKYGYRNKQGETVVNCEYDDATEQNAYGYAAVKKNGKWGCLNQEGKVVLEPSVDLEDVIKVDFIGNWHLGADINMNYYTK